MTDETKVLEGEYIPAEEPVKIKESNASCRPDFGVFQKMGQVNDNGIIRNHVFVFHVPTPGTTNVGGAADFNPNSVYFKNRKP